MCISLNYYVLNYIFCKFRGIIQLLIVKPVFVLWYTAVFKDISHIIASYTNEQRNLSEPCYPVPVY